MKLALIPILLGSCAAMAATEEQINKTFAVSPGGVLVVDVDFGSIDLATNVSSQVTADVWRKVSRRSQADEQQFLRDNPVTFTQDGNTVTIRCRAKSRAWSLGGARNRNEAKYKILVPAQFGAQLHTAGGSIGVTDLSGDVKTETSGGNLKFVRLHGPLHGETSGGQIDTVECAGALKLHTSGGAIDVTGGSGSLNGDTSGGGVAVRRFDGPANVETSGGGLTIENVKGKVTGSTSGGAINATLISPLPGPVSLSTSGGGVTVRVPANTGFELDAETSAGSVSSDLPVSAQGKPEHSRLKGPVNDGGPAVVLRSSGGSIHVKRL